MEWTDMQRVRLGDTRNSVTCKFTIPGDSEYPEGVEGYIICGMYPNWRLGEVFILASKKGSFIRLLLDSLSTMISIGLQYGVPLQVLTEKLRYTRGGPWGVVVDAPKEMRSDEGRPFIAKSVVDFIAALLDNQFPGGVYRNAPKEQEVTPMRSPDGSGQL